MVADGLPLNQGAQLPHSSVLRRDGVPRQRLTTHDGAALPPAAGKNGSPELTGQVARTRLVVLAINDHQQLAVTVKEKETLMAPSHDIDVSEIIQWGLLWFSLLSRLPKFTNNGKAAHTASEATFTLPFGELSIL